MLDVKALLAKILIAQKPETIVISTGKVTAYRRGNVVSVMFINAVTTSTTARTKFGTLPAGWRPGENCFSANISGNTGYGDVLTDGSVEAYRPTTGRVDTVVTFVAVQ